MRKILDFLFTEQESGFFETATNFDFIFASIYTLLMAYNALNGIWFGVMLDVYLLVVMWLLMQKEQRIKQWRELAKSAIDTLSKISEEVKKVEEELKHEQETPEEAVSKDTQ